jgi:hypothetical protein
MSISSREDVNKYYNLINGLVDEYIDSHKIKPSKLSAYLKPGGQRFNKFLERNKLKEISGTDRILRDVIEDREHMESDGVITFESFNLLESNEYKISSLKQCLYKGIEKSDINVEKTLADYFDINLGSIDVVDSDKHQFKIEDWKNDDWICVIYSEEDCDIIRNNFLDFFYEELSKKEVELVEGIKVSLSELVKREIFEEKMNKVLTEEKFKNLISLCLGEDWSFEKNFRDFYIWIS